MVRLGIRKSHYFGQAKTLFQVMLVATVANLALAATKMMKMRPGGGAQGLTSFLFFLLRRAFEELLDIRLRRLGPGLRIPALSRLPQPSFWMGFQAQTASCGGGWA